MIACQHCGQQFAGGARAFCCDGCETVYRLIRTTGLDRYYDLRGTATTAPVTTDGRRDRKWLMPILDRLSAVDSASRMELDIQGIHCMGCVWMIEELFRRQPGAIRIVVNPALGRVDLVVGHGFPLLEWVTRIEELGYRLGPAAKQLPHRRDKLLLRTVICLVLAGNTMMLSAAVYLGLRSGPVYDVVIGLVYALGCLSLVIGGGVFFCSSFQALRQRMVSFDVPISLGIILAFIASSWSLLAGDPSLVYFDTISVFIALMLLGRWLHSRVLSSNRNRLLENTGASNILTRRVRNQQVQFVPCSFIEPGDALLIAPGDLVCVDATLDAPATLSLDWINGESQATEMPKGARAPAGSFNVGPSAIPVVAETNFTESGLASLLAVPKGEARIATPALANRVAGYYVLAVLAAALVGWLGWWVATGDVQMALQVTTAVLVVTCPCAFGIAAPLAYELAHAGLRRVGLFVRRADFLDRVQSVHNIVFDKTGTLTSGRLELRNPDTIPTEHRRAIYNLAVRSNHPRSQAVRRAMEKQENSLFDPNIVAREYPGHGVEAVMDGHVHRLGSGSWAVDRSGNDLVFSIDGTEKVCLTVVEELRSDAREQVRKLREDGYMPWIVSGDAPDRVAAVATMLDIPSEKTVSSCCPEGKAAWLAARNAEDALFVGDGINDSLIADVAHCSGTPAIDLPFMPTRTDFYFTTAGLSPIRIALRVARKVAGVVRRNLFYAVSYNVLAVALAWSGWMRPWLAAILMPASSIAIVLFTVVSLSPRRAMWRC